MLRARFDVEHGDRRTWAVALFPIVRGELMKPVAAGLGESAAGALAVNAKTAAGIAIGLVLLLTGALLVATGDGFTAGEPRIPAEASESMDMAMVRRQASSRAPIEQVRGAMEFDSLVDQATTGSSTGQLLVHCRWFDDTPADSVQIILHPADDLRLLGKQRFVTDIDGRVLATGLRPGDFTVSSDRGDAVQARVRAGEGAEVRLKLDRGVDVHGTVVDAAGRPVARAQIYLAGRNLDWSAGFPVACSDPGGEFQLRSIQPEDSLWACAALHGPSEVLDLEQRKVSSGSIEIALRLSKSGGAVRGRVVDADGQSVEGARIALGLPPRNFLDSRVDGSQVEVRVPRVSTSDKRGRFAFEGMASGRQFAVVHAEGWPIWHREVTVESPGGPPLLIQLERGALVRGVVRDESGKPVEGAIVLALPRPFLDGIPGSGPDRGKPFPHPGARTDVRGTFALPPVAAGPVHLYASNGERRWSVNAGEDSVFLGSAQETLIAHAGQELVWEPKLSRGRTIKGRVIYADGAPMQRMFVNARRESGGLLKTTTTDSQGKFSISNLTAGSYRVSVVQRGAPAGTAPLFRERVLPDSGPLEFQATFSQHDTGTGRVSIRFADDGQRVETEATIVFANAQSWFRAEFSDGVYTTSLRPGRYRPVALAGDVEVGEGAWFDLGAGDALDLGTLHSAPGGDLFIRVNRGAAPEGDVELLVQAVDGLPLRTKNSVVLREGLDEFRVENLSIGPARVSLWGDHCLSEQLQIDILPGAVTEANVDLRRGALRDMEFLARNAQGAFELTLRDAFGEIVYESRRDESANPRGVLRYAIALPLGSFSIDARTGNGLEYRGEIEFKTFEPLENPLSFELR